MKKILLVSLLAIAACKKTDDTDSLPGPSSNGENYLACKVNGVRHIYKGLSTYMNPNGVAYLGFSNEVYLTGTESGNNDHLAMYVKIPFNTGVTNYDYYFGGESNQSYADYNPKKPGGTLEYRTASGSGWVRFSRIDTAVASGTFAFTAYRNAQKGTDSVMITDGRFDIAW
jgi:hypothetical protein